MWVIEQQTVPHTYIWRLGYPPRPGMEVGQSVTWAGFEPGTPGSLVSCLNHSGPLFGVWLSNWIVWCYIDMVLLVSLLLLHLLHVLAGWVHVHHFSSVPQSVRSGPKAAKRCFYSTVSFLFIYIYILFIYIDGNFTIRVS